MPEPTLQDVLAELKALRAEHAETQRTLHPLLELLRRLSANLPLIAKLARNEEFKNSERAARDAARADLESRRAG